MAGDEESAVQDLTNLRRRGDGCGDAPDANDWFLDCDDQAALQQLIDDLIELLQA